MLILRLLHGRQRAVMLTGFCSGLMILIAHAARMNLPITSLMTYSGLVYPGTSRPYINRLVASDMMLHWHGWNLKN
jgi:hypothetical protein